MCHEAGLGWAGPHTNNMQMRCKFESAAVHQSEPCSGYHCTAHGAGVFHQLFQIYYTDQQLAKCSGMRML